MTILKRRARIIVTAWVLAVVPLLLTAVDFGLWYLPRILRTGVQSLFSHVDEMQLAFGDGQIAAGLAALVSVVMLVVVPTGSVIYLLYLTWGQLKRQLALHLRGRRSRLAALVAALVAALALVAAWVVRGW